MENLSSKTSNPLKVGFAVFLFLSIFDFYKLFFEYAYKSTDIFGLIHPFVNIPFFLLYLKGSRFAWHALVLPIMIIYPVYVVLQELGIYSKPQFLVRAIVFIIWLGCLLYLFLVRKGYFEFLSARTFVDSET